MKLLELKLDRNFYALVLILGILSNSLAMAANDWKMPVLHDYPYQDNTHITYTDKESVKLWILTDIIPIPNKWYIISFSIGDVILTCSLVMLLVTQYQIIRGEIR